MHPHLKHPTFLLPFILLFDVRSGQPPRRGLDLRLSVRPLTLPPSFPHFERRSQRSAMWRTGDKEKIKGNDQRKPRQRSGCGRDAAAVKETWTWRRGRRVNISLVCRGCEGKRGRLRDEIKAGGAPAFLTSPPPGSRSLDPGVHVNPPTCTPADAEWAGSFGGLAHLLFKAKSAGICFDLRQPDREEGEGEEKKDVFSHGGVSGGRGGEAFPGCHADGRAGGQVQEPKDEISREDEDGLTAAASMTDRTRMLIILC